MQNLQKHKMPNVECVVIRGNLILNLLDIEYSANSG